MTWWFKKAQSDLLNIMREPQQKWEAKFDRKPYENENIDLMNLMISEIKDL